MASTAGVQFFRGAPLSVARHAKCCPDATTRRAAIVSVRSSAAGNSGTVEIEYEKGQGEARWAGDDPLARVLTSVISIKPVFKALKFFAQNMMIRTAEKSGVPWQKMVNELKESDVYSEKEILENVNISYPDCKLGTQCPEY